MNKSHAAQAFLGHPLERGDLVHQAIVTGGAMSRFGRQFRVREKSESAEPVVRAHQNDAVLSQTLAVEHGL